MEAIIYTRQSVAREETISHEIQESACRRYAETQGYNVLRVETDPGFSGLDMSRRRALGRAVEAIEHGEAEVLLVWRWSRLSRRQFDQAFLLDKIERAGGRVESALEPVSATAAGEFNRDVMLAMASFESRQKSETWKQAQSRRADKGLPTQGHKYFGYIKRHESYEIDPATAPFLREAYQRYISGIGFNTVAAYLNSEGASSIRWLKQDGTAAKLNRHWDSSSVRKTLDNPFNVGKFRRNGTLVVGAHSPVISESTWQAYSRVRSEKAGLAPRTKASDWYLAGLVRCALCGGSMGKNASGKNNYLMCTRQRKGGGCTGVTVLQEHVEWVVTLWFGSHLEDWAAALPSDDAAMNASEEAVGLAEHAVEQATTAVTDLQLMAVRQGWKDSQVASAMAILQMELDNASAGLETAQANLGAFVPAGSVLEQIRRGIELRGWWGDDDDEKPTEQQAQEWKALVGQIIKVVRCTPRVKNEPFSQEQIEVVTR
ncbi:recombinase family protein [Arthrobacter cheniae]|uniref:Recombinase family protein n=1 Tax=Arthrobacter cheniae TaxID=1258888 RepID=A0A3A5MC33_9MICC|nr:recombinase family protein [Arthrobacter cheniae]RJT78287.1 recombinase family protein [Arthrobacter cheniae]